MDNRKIYRKSFDLYRILMLHKNIFTKEKSLELYLKIFAGFILAVILVLYSFLWLNSCAPITEHWQLYYVELVKRGKLPYKDFYYYLPPLNLMIDCILWKFSGGKLIVYTCFRLVERILLSEIIYYELSRYFDWKKVWIFSLCGIILGTANVYDLFGDYTQSATFLIVLLLICLVRFIEKNEPKYLIGAGCFLSLEFFLKQNVFLAVAIVFFIALIVFCVFQKDKNFLKYFYHIVAGCILVLFVFFFYMYINDMIVPFFEQVYLGVDSKGNIINIIFLGLKIMLKNSMVLVLAITFFLIIYFAKVENTRLFFLATLLFGSLIYVNFESQIKETIYALKDSYVGYVIFVYIILFVLIGLFCEKKLSKFMQHFFLLLAISGIFLIYLYIAKIDFNSIATRIYETTGVFNILDYFDDFLTVLTIILMVYFAEKKESIQFIFVVSGFALAYSTVMSNGSGVAVCAYVLLLPITLTILTSVRGKCYKVRNYCIFGVIFFACFVCMCQKVICPYSWWGCTSFPLSERTEEMNSKFLAGYKLSVDEKKKYELITKVIESNIPEDGVVWGYPNITIYNFLTERFNINGFVPIPWYDVCSKEYAKKEAYLLEKNNPDIVVWCDIPGAIEVHESMYLQGEELGQRDIIKWFYSAEKEDYELIGQMDNVYVYKLIKNNQDISYSYIENPERENATLNIVD